MSTGSSQMTVQARGRASSRRFLRTHQASPAKDRQSRHGEQHRLRERPVDGTLRPEDGEAHRPDEEAQVGEERHRHGGQRGLEARSALGRHGQPPEDRDADGQIDDRHARQHGGRPPQPPPCLRVDLRLVEGPHGGERQERDPDFLGQQRQSVEKGRPDERRSAVFPLDRQERVQGAEHEERRAELLEPRSPGHGADVRRMEGKDQRSEEGDQRWQAQAQEEAARQGADQGGEQNGGHVPAGRISPGDLVIERRERQEHRAVIAADHGGGALAQRPDVGQKPLRDASRVRQGRALLEQHEIVEKKPVARGRPIHEQRHERGGQQDPQTAARRGSRGSWLHDPLFPGHRQEGMGKRRAAQLRAWCVSVAK